MVHPVTSNFFSSKPLAVWSAYSRNPPPVGQGLLIVEASPAQPVGLLWTTDQPIAKICTRQHTQHSQQTNDHAPGGFRTRNPSKTAAADPRVRPRCHWDRLTFLHQNGKMSAYENFLQCICVCVSLSVFSTS